MNKIEIPDYTDVGGRYFNPTYYTGKAADLSNRLFLAVVVLTLALRWDMYE